MVHDLLAIIGLVLICSGVYALYGWPWAAIIAGIALIGAAIVGITNATTETSES